MPKYGDDLLLLCRGLQANGAQIFWDTLYSLRDTGTNLRLPMKRSANGQRCFSYRGAKLWNSLSAESKQATSLYGFKKTI